MTPANAGPKPLPDPTGGLQRRGDLSGPRGGPRLPGRPTVVTPPPSRFALASTTRSRSGRFDRGGNTRVSRSVDKRVARHGLMWRGVLYPWVYWAVVALAFVLLIVDIFADGAIWNIGVVVCVIIAIAVRPGGLRGPRADTDAADAADEPAPRAT